jgi:hypothetical protein
VKTTNYPIGKLWESIQKSLFPELEDMVGELTEKERKFIMVCELSAEPLESEMKAYKWNGQGRPPAERPAIAKAFIAKAVYGIATTEGLVEYLKGSPTLRRLCGWESVSEIPSESTFSRAFGDFAEGKLPEKVHEAIVKAHGSRKLGGHISRDATAIAAREKAVKKPVEEKTEPVVRKKGRPRQGEQREKTDKEMKRLERQIKRTLMENLDELPRKCDWGCKRNSDGKKEVWKGYKLHVDTMDGDIPVSAVLTAASLHDSQAAVPLAQMSAERVTNFYDLMDAAYDAGAIRGYSEKLGHIAIIDANPRGGEKIPMEPAQARRYNERSTSERIFAYLENYGAYTFRVRGAAKVMCHLMFAVLALTAQQIFHLIL